LTAQFAKFPRAADLPPDMRKLLADTAAATNALLTARQNILDYVSKAPLVTFDYTGLRAAKAVAPATQLPDRSKFHSDRRARAVFGRLIHGKCGRDHLQQ
jgi:hypothetical protein